MDKVRDRIEKPNDRKKCLNLKNMDGDIMMKLTVVNLQLFIPLVFPDEVNDRYTDEIHVFSRERKFYPAQAFDNRNLSIQNGILRSFQLQYCLINSLSNSPKFNRVFLHVRELVLLRFYLEGDNRAFENHIKVRSLLLRARWFPKFRAPDDEIVYKHPRT
ncbi:MAG: hypothetical protein ACQKBT_12630 [Puniceicoccales bacterium]